MSVEQAAGPYALLVALFIVTVVLGQLIGNTATALIMIPIAGSAAAQLDLSARPALMSLCVASAAAFLTPIATPANMMIMGPAAIGSVTTGSSDWSWSPCSSS